jgi:hypothetical protein
MASPVREQHGRITCLVDASPEVVDAGTELALTARVSCSPACDLEGHTLVVRDPAGADVGTVALRAFDGTTNESDEFVVKAPVKAGPCTWLVVCAATVKDGVAYTEVTTPVTVAVEPHTTSVVAWDVPPAVEAGERFRIKIGVKCSSECALADRAFNVLDHEGACVATGMLTGDCWPGTTGLRRADVELQAPAGEGLYAWSVECPQWDVGIPHGECSVTLGVRVVRTPESLVTVEAVDSERQAPLSGARVVMHPYRAVTDARGVAAMRIAKGAYTLFVSHTGYLTRGLPLDVSGDVTTRVELGLEPSRERD